MIFRQHVPEEPLARYVDWFWFFEDMYPPHRREHMLPDGTFELVIDLREEPRRMFDRGGSNGETLFREAWMSGAHSQYIVIDALPGSSMIGVHFKPGGAAAILGFPADELRDQVVALDAIWGGTAAELRERLLQARGARAKFAILERSLSDRLTGRNLDEAQQRRVFWARDQFLTTDPVRISDVVNQVGNQSQTFYRTISPSRGADTEAVLPNPAFSARAGADCCASTGRMGGIGLRVRLFRPGAFRS